MRDMTYESWIQVNITEEFGAKKRVVHKRVNLGKIPMMLGCDYCNLVSYLRMSVFPLLENVQKILVDILSSKGPNVFWYHKLEMLIIERL